MSRFKSLLFAVVILLSPAIPLHSQVVLSLEPTINLNEIEVNVVVQNFDSMATAQLSIQFDPNVLEFTDLTYSSFFQIHDFGTSHADEGWIGFAWMNFSNPASGVYIPDGTVLFTLHFQSIGFGNSWVTIGNDPIPVEFIHAWGTPETVLFGQQLISLEGSFLKGQVFFDELANCSPDADEFRFSGIPIVLQGPDTVYTITDEDGNYSALVDTGTYQVWPILTDLQNWEASCGIPLEIAVPNQFEIYTADIPLATTDYCADMKVGIRTPFLRRCAENTYLLEYCNKGSIAAQSAYVDVQFDAGLTLVMTELPYQQIGDIYRFELGDIPILGCGSFNLTFFCDCELTLGITECVSAHIYPDSSCKVLPEWSGANIKLEGYCEDEQVRFLLENNGVGDMAQPLEYIVIEDGSMLTEPQLFQLQSGESLDFYYPANGSTYQMLAAQETANPSVSTLIRSVEGCGTNEQGLISTGFVTALPTGDEDDYLDFECRQVIGSYDPNDKQVFPTGVFEEHFVKPGNELEYLIRFQNVGTDTAFNILVSDTLSAALDLTTFRMIGASHGYSVEISGDRVLSCYFNQIMLPDSNVNQLLSNGYLRFKISPLQDIPLGTVIYNQAAIYFDHNDPVITNETWTTIDINFLPTPVRQLNAISQIEAYPNPSLGQTVVEWKNEADENSSFLFQLFDTQGKKMLETPFTGTRFALNSQTLPEGFYTFRIINGIRLTGIGKLIIQK